MPRHRLSKDPARRRLLEGDCIAARLVAAEETTEGALCRGRVSKAPGEHHLGPLKGTPAPHPPHSSTSTIIISLLCVGAVNWRCDGPNTSELLPLPDCRGSAERRCWGGAPGGRCPREAAPAVSAETRGSAGLAAQRPWGCGARLSSAPAAVGCWRARAWGRTAALGCCFA